MTKYSHRKNLTQRKTAAKNIVYVRPAWTLKTDGKNNILGELKWEIQRKIVKL